MAVYLVRHGQTEWSLSQRHTGSSDIPLTAAGEVEARGLGPRLAGGHFSRVLCSPRGRARRTAELAGYGSVAEVSPLLAEFDYGDYEGLTTQQIHTRAPGWQLWRDGCPGGETPIQVLERAYRLLAELEPSEDRDFLLFGHGHILRAVAVGYLGMEVDLCAHLVLDVASISRLGWEHDLPAIASWNLT